ncbi:hypothetical protein V5799_012870 [Amblyomma americanum]|uniref:TRASH domain-containing protein n=1 Tax=Amblyomma americanum TaxID=6943 RepID=A0AAQ4E7G8_AMBAM
MSRSRPGHLKPCCAWCEDNRKDLRHAITVGHVRKEFCSENCLHEFKRVYLKAYKLDCPPVVVASISEGEKLKEEAERRKEGSKKGRVKDRHVTVTQCRVT